MDFNFKNLAIVLLFNVITQALPIGAAIYIALKWAMGEKTITISGEKTILKERTEI